MISYDFLKLTVDSVFKTSVSASELKVPYWLGDSPNTKFEDLGSIAINWNRTDDDTNKTITLDTPADTSYYFGYTTAGENHIVEYINAMSYKSHMLKSGTYSFEGKHLAYAIPLAKAVTLPDGYTIKVNPYKENESGEHIRGIRLKFSLT